MSILESHLAPVLVRLRALFGRQRIEDELDSELRFHLEMEIEENLRLGMSPAEARRAARLAFGGIEGVKEAHRDQRGVRWLEDLARDTRWAWRRFTRRPGATLAAIATLGLGVGATVAVYGMIRGVLFEPLPFGAGDRIVQIRQPVAARDVDDMGFSVPELDDLRSQTRSFEAIVEYHSLWFNLFNEGKPERVLTGVVTAGFFRHLGVEPAAGRLFLDSDAHHGADPVLLLSHAYFRDRFGGDPAVVGRQVEMNERLHTIVGVLPPLTRFPRADDVYMPTLACPFRNGDGWLLNRGFRALTLLGVRKVDVTMEAAQAELAELASLWRSEHGELYPVHAGHSMQATSLLERLTAQARPVLAALLATVLLVCLLACANVANLGLAQGLQRLGELRMQIALGAGRGRLIRQLVTESLLLGIAAGAVGWLLARATHGTLLRFVGRLTPRAEEIHLDLHLVFAAIGLAIVAAAAAGALPTLSLLRRRGIGSGPVGRTTDDPERSRLRDALVTAQVAFAVVLLAAAALFGRSFWKLQHVGPGFEGQNVLTMRLALDFQKYGDGADREAFYRGILEDVRSLPGVEEAALVGQLPLSGGLFTTPARIAGDERTEAELPRIDLRVASDGWFETARIRLLRGRTFQRFDRAEGETVGLLSHSAALRLFGEGTDPLDQIVTVRGLSDVRIIGLVDDVRQEGLANEPAQELYVVLAQSPPLAADLAVRSTRPEAAVLREIESVIHRRDPKQPVASVQSLEELRQEDLAPARVLSTLMGTLAGLAFLITAVGIGAVVAFAVGRRTREIGIRRALGAADLQVVRLLIQEGMGPVVVGLVLGLAFARIATPSLDRFLYRVGASDPWTHLVVALGLFVVAVLACALPARRAVGVDPLRALQAE